MTTAPWRARRPSCIVNSPELPPLETWRPVVDFEHFYEVSDIGRVRRVAGGPGAVVGRIMKTRIGPKGYRLVALCVRGKKHHRTVHSLVAKAFLGPRPPGYEICHSDSDSLNNCSGNLRYDTSGGNKLDQVKAGTHPEAKKTHCVNGHELAGANLMPSLARRGRRGCLACHRARDRASYARRKG